MRYATFLAITAALLAACHHNASTAAPGAAQAPSSMLAATPPMGWNSWNKFGCNIDEDLIEQTADAMVSSGMRDAGYKYVNIDDCWMAKTRDAAGQPADRSGPLPARHQGHRRLRPRQGPQARHLFLGRHEDLPGAARLARSRGGRRQQVRRVGRRLPQVRQLQQREATGHRAVHRDGQRAQGHRTADRVFALRMGREQAVGMGTPGGRHAVAHHRRHQRPLELDDRHPRQAGWSGEVFRPRRLERSRHARGRQRPG